MSAQNEYRGTSGTKYKLVLLTILLGTLALFLGKIPGEAWGLYVVGLVAVYITGDVGARFSASKVEPKENQP